MQAIICGPTSDDLSGLDPPCFRLLRVFRERVFNRKSLAFCLQAPR